MKQFFPIIIIAMVFISSLSKSISEEITLISLSDTHSCLAPSAPRNEELKGTTGGAARAASIIGQIKNNDPKSILLHAGDIAIGDLFFNKYFSVPELTFLKQMGCDALTLGNHEFDLGPEVLQMAMGTAFEDGGFPIISTNLETFDNPDMAWVSEMIKPYTIIERAENKIGVFGMTTPEANVFSMPSPLFLDTLVIERAMTTVAELQAQGCNIIIMSSHLGKKLDEVLAYYVAGIDLIVGAHDHQLTSEAVMFPTGEGTKIPFVQCSPFYQSISKTILNIEDGKLISVNHELIELDSSVPEEPTVVGMVDQLIAGIEETYGPLFSQQVGMVTEDMEEECIPKFTEEEVLDTPVGNLICDAFLQYGQTDIAIQPGGSTSQMLHKGPIVGDDVFRMIGYGFNVFNGLGYRIAKFKMTGMELMFGLEFGLSQMQDNDEFLLQVGGMKYVCNLNEAPFSRILSVEVGGEPIDPDKVYSITANEFVVGMLQYLGIPFSDLEINEELTEFEVVLDYISKVQVINPESGRITTPVLEIESSRSTGYNVYPNPCDRNLCIIIPETLDKAISIQIFSLNGDLVYTDVVNNCNLANEPIMVETQQLNEGSYFFRLSSKNFQKMGGFIVSH